MIGNHPGRIGSTSPATPTTISTAPAVMRANRTTGLRLVSIPQDATILMLVGRQSSVENVGIELYEQR